MGGLKNVCLQRRSPSNLTTPELWLDNLTKCEKVHRVWILYNISFNNLGFILNFKNVLFDIMLHKAVITDTFKHLTSVCSSWCVWTAPIYCPAEVRTLYNIIAAPHICTQICLSLQATVQRSLFSVLHYTREFASCSGDPATRRECKGNHISLVRCDSLKQPGGALMRRSQVVSVPC